MTALLTAFYMSRQVFMVFFGEQRWKLEADDEHPAPEPHESPWLMTVPLVVLAGLAVVAGALNLPFTDTFQRLEHWLHPVVGANERILDVSTATKVGLALVAVVTALVGIALAYAVYLRRRIRAVEPKVLAEAWYYDRTITDFVGGPGEAGFEAVAAFDQTVIDGAVNGIAGAVGGGGRGLRVLQTGFVRTYALGIGVGVVALLVYFLSRGM